MYDAFEKITGGAKPKKEIKEMVHTKSDNGKHIVTHRHHRPDHHRDETHVADHIENHAGTPNEGEAAPAGGAPTPMTPAPSPEAAPAGPMPAGM